jgi:cyclopropane fatty-acyl-phospholipid synthase-like methyltransferase
MQPIDSEASRAREARLTPGMNGDYLAAAAEPGWPASMEKLAAHYENKTTGILQRYGPGPLVHYHTGFADEPSPLPTPEMLRSQLIRSQERMLRYASDSWQLRRTEFRDLLDVGCGLGGSAIFWAQEFGARVTAITIAASHVELVAEFARQAGVEWLVMPMLCEASAVPGEDRFDAAIAIESSSLFPRRPWFRCLARVLRPGGRVFISDCFLEDSAYEEPFNRHWCGQIGTIDEYLEAAGECDFRLEATEDVSPRTATFWATTLELIRAEATESTKDASRLGLVRESLEVHDLMRGGLLDGGLRQAFLSFVRR